MMRNLFALCCLAFALGLGVVVAYRMQVEAMAVVIGVVCGLLASIPATLVLLAAMREQRRAPPPAAPPAPPAVTVSTSDLVDYMNRLEAENVALRSVLATGQLALPAARR